MRHHICPSQLWEGSLNLDFENCKQHQPTARRNSCKISFTDICRKKIYTPSIMFLGWILLMYSDQINEDQSQRAKVCACACMHACTCQGLKGAEKQLSLASQEARVAATHTPGTSGFKGSTVPCAGLTACLSHMLTAALSEAPCCTGLSITLPSSPIK